MKNNNKGFTLVELIVGMVIFGIIAAAALGFLAASSQTYGLVSSEMNQRLDNGLAVNQISEYLIDCNGSVKFESNTLTIKNTDKTYVFQLVDGQLLFGVNAAQDMLAANVTDFSISFTSANALHAAKATITLKTERRGESLTTENVVALRNKPEYGI